jgi:uncharacterized protein YfdQ (DUF2303 family)
MAERTTTSSAGAVVASDGIVRDVRSLVEHYVHADVILVTDPTTGAAAPVIRSGSSVTALPPSIFDPYLAAPRHRQGVATMLSLDSLIEQTKRFSDQDSVVFANDDRASPSLTTVFDYHPKGGPDTKPRHGRHRATFTFPLSDEWKAWTEKNGEVMSMADFAAFVENRLPDVLYLIPGEDSLPEDLQRLVETLGGADTIATPNKLMELARGLQVNENAVAQETVNLASGEGIIRFQAQHTDETGAPLRVPALFLIAIPVFRNGPFYRIAARLRYRKQSGRIVFWYELWRTDRTFDHAFSEAVERVHIETELPVLIGKPEA